MLKLNYVLAATLLFPLFSYGANNFDDEVNAELDRMYQRSAQQQQQAPASQPTLQQPVQQQVVVPVQQVQAAPQKQPTTVIEASPLTESKTDKIRKARQEAEIQTEQKIVEKLEMSRMEDERRRAEVLFGDKFNTLTAAATPTPTPAPVAPAAPPVVTQPTAAAAVAPVVVVPPPVVSPVQEVTTGSAVKSEGLDREGVRSEISAALADFSKEKEEKAKENKMYVSGLLGVGEYPDSRYVKGQYAAGFSVGKTFSNQAQIEGSFMYSSYQVEQVCSIFFPCGAYYGGTYYPTITKMDQYQGSLAAKLQVLSGMLRPVVGGAVSYTYRSFTDTQFARYNSDATSQALDLGLILGADIMLSDTFSVGIDYRYFVNLTNQNSSQFQKSFVNPQNPGSKPIEQLNYYTLGIVGRTSF